MRSIGFGIILMLSGLVGPVELAASGSCECQHQCIQDKRENSTYIARVMVKNEITSPYQGASAYRVIVKKFFPNTIENVKRTILLTDDKCPANLQPKTTYLLAGSVVNDIPCSDPIMWVTNCDVAVPWKYVSKKQYKLLKSGMAFKYCEESPCNTGEICSRTDTEQCYTCQCPAGYDGCNCEHDIDECQTNPCQNGGNCTDGVNTYTCSCVDGFDGDNCENNIDDCHNNPCQNGGNCTDGVNSHTCSCVAGFDGVNCQTNIDDCQTTPCQNDGSCKDEVNSYTCTCVDGFDGNNCENIYCDFDHSLCGWRQDSRDDFDWTRHSGKTDSSHTGPDGDHTTGRGYYMYIESSHRNRGDRASLISPTFHLRNTQYECLTFWYHMNGIQMEELRVIAEHQVNGSLNTYTLWHQKGNHGNVWLYANATLSHPGPFTVTFEAAAGRGYKSDLAIDDVKILPYHCMSRVSNSLDPEETLT